jgi:hypothetical protein
VSRMSVNRWWRALAAGGRAAVASKGAGAARVEAVPRPGTVGWSCGTTRTLMEHVVNNCASKISLSPYHLHALCMGITQKGSHVETDLLSVLGHQAIWCALA